MEAELYYRLVRSHVQALIYLGIHPRVVGFVSCIVLLKQVEWWVLCPVRFNTFCLVFKTKFLCVTALGILELAL